MLYYHINCSIHVAVTMFRTVNCFSTYYILIAMIMSSPNLLGPSFLKDNVCYYHRPTV